MNIPDEQFEVIEAALLAAQGELAAIAAIRDGTSLAAHDWESLPLANWVIGIGPNAATAERRRIVESLTKEGV